MYVTYMKLRCLFVVANDWDVGHSKTQQQRQFSAGDSSTPKRLKHNHRCISVVIISTSIDITNTIKKKGIVQKNDEIMWMSICLLIECLIPLRSLPLCCALSDNIGIFAKFFF